MNRINKPAFLRVSLYAILFIVFFELLLFGFVSYNKQITINSLYPKSEAIHTHIESVFQSTITISEGYLSFITSNIDASKEETEVFLDYLFTYDKNYINNIAIIEGTHIKYNYPYEENQSSIGVDLSQVDSQKDDVLYVKNSLSPLFVGPVDLVQGGSAFILRIPIIVSDSYWGQMSVVIDANTFIDSIEDEAILNGVNVHIIDKNTQRNIYLLGDIKEGESLSTDYINKYLSWNIDVAESQRDSRVITDIINRVIGYFSIFIVCYYIYKNILLNTEFSYNSTHDSLTGDYNRGKFLTDYNNGRFKGMLIAFTDVNKFKLLNDTLGHSFGDWCLTQLSNKLNSFEVFRTYRISGDEFILVSKKPMLISEFESIMGTPNFVFYNSEFKQDIDIKISIGVLEKLEEDITLESILMYLDYAMYDAKKEHKGFTIVDKELMNLYDETKVIEQQLIDDIKNNKLIPFYQPIINLESKSIEGFEVLSRWLYKGEIRSAAMFIGVVKKIKYVDLVDLNLFEKLQEEYVDLIDQCPKIRDCSFSINLSAESLMIFERNNIEFDKLVKNRVIPIDKVIFEISEDMNLGLISIDTLRYIQRQGFDISVDDFGAGVSKLSDVLSGELHTIKTDKSLLPSGKHMDKKTNGFNTIIKAIKASGSTICVEGVESKDQLDISVDAGCKLAQGYLFSKPIPKSEVIEFVNTFNFADYE